MPDGEMCDPRLASAATASAAPPTRGGFWVAVRQLALSSACGFGVFYLLRIALYLWAERPEYWPDIASGFLFATVFFGATLFRILEPSWRSLGLRLLAAFAVFVVASISTVPAGHMLPEPFEAFPSKNSPLTPFDIALHLGLYAVLFAIWSWFVLVVVRFLFPPE